MRFNVGVVQRSLAGNGEAELAGEGEIVGGEPVDAGDIEGRRAGVELESPGGEGVSAVELDFAGFVVEGGGGEVEDLVGDAALDADAGDGLAEEGALVELEPARSVEGADGAGGVDLSVDEAGDGEGAAGEGKDVGERSLSGAKVEAEEGIGVEMGSGGLDGGGERTGEGNGSGAVGELGVGDVNAGGRVGAGGVDGVEVDGLWPGRGVFGVGRELDGEVGGAGAAGDVGIDE